MRPARARLQGSPNWISQSASSAISGKYGSFSTGGIVPPRSTRAGNVSHIRRHPLAAAIRAAARSPRSRSAAPPINSATFAPSRRRISAAARTALSGAAGRDTAGRGVAGAPASLHWQSEGTISVDVWPGGRIASAIASAVSAAIAPALAEWRTQAETGRASDSISEVSGASAFRCQVAWSPITLTIGECARRALCRLAIPLAKPGPRWVSVRAGRSAIRA